MVVDRDTELRKLRPGEVYNLALILNISDNWKKLMGSVIKEGTIDVPRFTGESISIIEHASLQERKPAAAIFIEEWATMGRKRPTLGLLFDLLMKVELFRAADYLAEDILKIAAPQRPTSGPALPIDAEEALVELLRRQNLKSQPISEDPTFVLHVAPEIRLSQINYPVLDTDTSITDNNFVIDDTDDRIIEMEYNEPRSNQVLDHATFEHPNNVHAQNGNHSIISEDSDFMKELKNNVRVNKNNNLPRTNDFEISDLMKFSANSKSDELDHSQKIIGHSRSDLIKFESSKINVDTSKENDNNEICDAYLPDFNILSPNSSLKPQQSSESNKGEARSMKFNGNGDFDRNYAVGPIREMSSAELPASLGKFGAAKYFHRELMSAELPLCINDRTGFQLDSREVTSSQENSLAASLQSFPSSSSIETSENLSPELNIPRAILEDGIAKRIDDRNMIAATHEKTNTTFNSQELPVTVLEFHKR